MSPANPSIAFLFPGQGSQRLGMGRALAQSEPQAAVIFQKADEQLGFALSRICWEGPGEALNETANTQPALLTHSVAVLQALAIRFPDLRPTFVAGHSLGELSALVAAGALSFEEALHLVRERGLAMQKAGQMHPGGMAAVLGLDLAQVEEACHAASDQAEGGVWVANDNCPGQIVISGDEGAVAIAEELLSARGARKVVRLAVSIAAHSPLMIPAQLIFNEVLNTADVRDPQIPVIGNVSAAPLDYRTAVIRDLSAQLTERVRWSESIRAMRAAGVETFLEIGSGNVLCGLLRRIDRSAKSLALDAPDTFASLENMLSPA